MRLLILTGARRKEIGGLKWSEIDDNCIRLEGSRTKTGVPHIIPVSTPARAVLESLPHVNEYVFGARVIAWSRIKAKLDESGVENWRLHDLRRTASTGMNELGSDPHIVEAVLGHKVKGVAGVYNHAKYKASQLAALEAWGAHVMALIEGRECKVVPLARV